MASLTARVAAPRLVQLRRNLPLEPSGCRHFYRPTIPPRWLFFLALDLLAYGDDLRPCRSSHANAASLPISTCDISLGPPPRKRGLEVDSRLGTHNPVSGATAPPRTTSTSGALGRKMAACITGKFAAGTALLALLGFSRVQHHGLRADPGNIVLIVADDLRYGDLGAYGNPTIRTPQLDRLAFERSEVDDVLRGEIGVYASRAALLTGRLPIRTG